MYHNMIIEEIHQSNYQYIKNYAASNDPSILGIWRWSGEQNTEILSLWILYFHI